MPPPKSVWSKQHHPLAKIEKRLKGRLDELLALYELPKAIQSHKELGKLLDTITRKVASLSEAPVCTVRLLNANGDILHLKSAYGLTPLDRKLRKDLRIGKSIVGSVVKAKRPFLSNHLSKERRYVFHDFVRRRRFFSILSVPILTDGKVLGALTIYGRGGRNFREEDTQILTNFASQVAVLVEGARLQAKAHESYLKTIGILVNIIDIKDSYTRGHSERVMRLCEEIADQMHLSPHERELAKYGGLLHDLGKIGIDVKILRKPGPLTAEEWKKIHQHPKIGADILRRSGILKDLAPVILSDHERYGGGGYPDPKIKGNKIPLASRIVAVADAYEVITTDRPYRKARSRREAIAELKRCAGTQFDPKVVRALLHVLKRKLR